MLWHNNGRVVSFTLPHGIFMETSVRILIVEDETIVGLDTEDRLASLGYASAGCVRTGEQALETVEREHPNLVLMEIRLQGEMDGVMAAGQIRDRFRLPVIFLTAYSDDAILERAKRVEPYGYILKPFDDGELKAAIETALYKHQAEQEARLASEQRVRKRTAELEAANRELDAFAHSVSHDLRAPLRAIEGFVGILDDGYRGRLDDEGQRLLGTIRDQARHMGRLVNHLLRLSRLSRKSLQQAAVDMDRLVGEVVEQLRRAESGRAIEFRLSRLPTVVADASLLRQVWANLLDNSLKFTRCRDPAVIEVGGVEEEQGVVFSVRDNGVGFDARFADRLFAPFQRLHRADEYEGTGIGLSLVQRVIHRHGGRLWATSEPEQGATFSFLLPHTNLV